MFCFQKYTRHLLKLILSPQSRHQSLSLGTIQVCNAVLCSPRGTTGVCHSCDECKKSTLPIVCDWSCTLVHWPKQVTTSNSCQLSMSINLRANFWLLSNWFNFLLFELLIIQMKMRNFVKLLHCLLLPIHGIVQHIFERVPPCRKTTLLFVREFSAITVIFLLLQLKYVTQTSSCAVQMIVSFGLHSRWVRPKCTWSRNDAGSSITIFFKKKKSSPLDPIFCFSPAILMAYTDRNRPRFRWTNIFQFRIFSHSTNKASWCFLWQSGLWMTVQISFKKNHGMFIFCPWFGPLMLRNAYPKTQTFWIKNVEQAI